MNQRVLILAPFLLLFAAPGIHAHNVVSVNGNTQGHQHVYRRQQYGKPLQQGHLVQSQGGSGTVFWGSDMQPAYGKSNVRRSGPIIDGYYRNSGSISNSGKKYGSAVQGYGKPVRGYGKPVRGYGQNNRNQ